MCGELRAAFVPMIEGMDGLELRMHHHRLQPWRTRVVTGVLCLRVETTERRVEEQRLALQQVRCDGGIATGQTVFRGASNVRSIAPPGMREQRGGHVAWGWRRRPTHQCECVTQASDGFAVVVNETTDAGWFRVSVIPAVS
jgi:hypothetical protein